MTTPPVASMLRCDRASTHTRNPVKAGSVSAAEAIGRFNGQDARCPHRQDACATEETLWRSAMYAETITTNHFKLLQLEKLEPLTASSVRFTCWRRPVRIVVARSSGTVLKLADTSIVASIAPKNLARTGWRIAT